MFTEVMLVLVASSSSLVLLVSPPEASASLTPSFRSWSSSVLHMCHGMVFTSWITQMNVKAAPWHPKVFITLIHTAHSSPTNKWLCPSVYFPVLNWFMIFSDGRQYLKDSWCNRSRAVCSLHPWTLQGLRQPERTWQWRLLFSKCLWGCPWSSGMALCSIPWNNSLGC